MKKQILRSICCFMTAVTLMGMLSGCTNGKAVAANKENEVREVEISSENIMNTVKELISEKYNGRLVGTAGNQLAAKYIAENYKKIGLECPTDLDNYMQYYQQPKVELTDKPVLQILDKDGKVAEDVKYVENFVLRRLSSETNKMNIEAPLFLVEDSSVLFQNDSRLKGKILLIPYKYNDMLGYHNTPTDYADICGALGAIGEFDLANNSLGFSELKVSTLIGPWLSKDSYKPFAYVDSGTFGKLAEAAKAGCKVHLGCSSETGVSNYTANVVGLISGSDSAQKENCVIIGAHFDHVGSNMDGTYNPGALDNASGPSALLELARVLKESKVQPKQSILFIAFNGESCGLYGSGYYCKHPLNSLDKSVMINLDMVGSAAELPLLIAKADTRSDTTLQKELMAYAKELSIQCEEGIEPGSDHTSFSNAGVPSVLLINMDYKSGYHTPNDTVKSVDGERVKEIVGLVRYYIQKKAY